MPMLEVPAKVMLNPLMDLRGADQDYSNDLLTMLNVSPLCGSCGSCIKSNIMRRISPEEEVP